MKSVHLHRIHDSPQITASVQEFFLSPHDCSKRRGALSLTFPDICAGLNFWDTIRSLHLENHGWRTQLEFRLPSGDQDMLLAPNSALMPTPLCPSKYATFIDFIPISEVPLFLYPVFPG